MNIVREWLLMTESMMVLEPSIVQTFWSCNLWALNLLSSLPGSITLHFQGNGVEDVPMTTTSISNGGGTCTYMHNDHENGIPSTYLNNNGVHSDSVSNSLLDTNQGDTSTDRLISWLMDWSVFNAVWTAFQLFQLQLLYPTQWVAEGIMFLTRPSVSQSVSQSVLQSCFSC